MERLLSFESYNFENLDRSWIKSVWDSSFTRVQNMPIDYLTFLENKNVTRILNDNCVQLKKWISHSDRQAQLSWQTLIGLDLDVRALLAILAFLIKRGQALDASRDYGQSCLGATSLYFVLLSIPGSNTFQAFHPGLYEAALKTLTLSQQRLICSDAKTAKKSSLDYRDEDFVAEDEDFRSKPQSLPKWEATILTKSLNGVVFDLVTMLKSTATCLDIGSLEATVFNLVELTKLANETMEDFSRARNSEASINSLAYNAYVALGFLCNPKYATIPVATRIIGKYLLPQLLISSANKFPPKQMTIIRDSTIHFLKTLLENHGRESQEALVTLIQHLMIKSPERLEGRQKQAVVVIKLINICQGNAIVYKQCLKDLMLFSVHNKISCRIFAQEIIGKYLLELSSSHNRREVESSGDWSWSDTSKLLLAGALSRCVDSSSMVRGRAIATLAEYTDSIEKPQVRSLFQGGETSREGTTEMPILEDLVAAIEDKNEIKKILPNFRGVIAMLKRRGEDERALIRRSSLQALRNGILVLPELLEEVAPLITSQCRDAALTVRRFAIRVITTLFETYPENPSLCGLWVDSVVPRVFDSEPKVQEEVLNSLEKLTVGKIARASAAASPTGKTSTDDFPWRILRELAVKKMGDHLAKACGVWVKCGTIDSSTIANIESHIGTHNNFEAWLLLASLAENTSIGKMDSHYNYFVEAVRDDSTENGFFASVVLQVLRHSWRSFGNESLTRIREVMLKHLKLYGVRETLISHCLDILHGIATFRSVETSDAGEAEEGGGAETMRELMRLAEATITRLVDVDEDGQSDEPNPGKLLLRATCTLGHASFLCTEKISVPTLRILQGFLLEWDSLPSRIRATNRDSLQGVAVTVLGQQALRDREIAQEMTPIFGRLLRRNTSSDCSRNTRIANGAAVRINTAKALADICVRFTALVEPFLPDMCVSMKDPNPQVRQVILVIFIQLLAEDFIKINGPFFFNILSMLSDSDETIRRMTVFLIKERLISKNKSLVTRQFVNCIYHFNDYERRLAAGSRRRKKRARELEVSTIPAGEKGAAERRLIYDFMLENLDAPGKLTILVGLSRQIFKCRCTNGRSALGQLNVNTRKGMCVFRDALYVLASDHLQPNSCARLNVDEDNLEEATPTPTSTISTASSVIVEAMKKHRLRILLPGLVELKERFAQANSPLFVDVAKFISGLLSDYNKDQLENLYNEYPELEKQIERDIRECEEEEEEEEKIREEKTTASSIVSSTPKKSKYDASLVANSDWMPKIVLRRISTLTYPEISQLRQQNAAAGFHSETAQTRVNIERATSVPRVLLRRLEEHTNCGISELADSNLDSNSRSKNEKASTSRSRERSIPRRTRSSSCRD